MPKFVNGLGRQEKRGQAMISDLLVISAVKFEAKPTLEMLDSNGVNYEYMEFGVGPINAAKSALKIKNGAKGKNVLYLGSVGTFGVFTDPHLVVIDKVWWMPTAERMGLAKCMEDMNTPVDIPLTGYFDLPVRQILTSSSVSFTADISVNLPQHDVLVENMEAYSIVGDLIESAQSLDVIMGVSNAVCPEGSTQWAENFELVSNMTAKYLERLLCR